MRVYQRKGGVTLRRWKRKLRVWLSMGTTMSLLLTAYPAVGAAPVPINTQPAKRAALSLRESATPAYVSMAAQQAAKAGGKTTFLVMLRDQANVHAAAAIGQKQAQQRGAVSRASIELGGRQEIVQALQETARTTQADLAVLLDRMLAQGQISDYRPLWIVNGFLVTGNAKAINLLANEPAVARIDLDEKVYLSAPPPPQAGPGVSVPKVGAPQQEATAQPDAISQKGAEPQGAPTVTGVEWNIDRVGAPAVWALGTDGSGTVVASIDTGVEWNHPALITRFRGYDPDNPGAPRTEGNWFDAVSGRSTPYDDNGHGTHVTGTMVGRDGDDTMGVAPGAQWIAVKAFTAAGSGALSSLLIAGEYLLAPTDANGTPHPEWAPDVINNSWGGGPGLDEWFRPMVQAWRAAGIFPAFASGNIGPGDATVSEPGNYPESFAVGATDRNDMVASFSSRGPSPYGEIKPNIAAPGAGIRSSIPGGGYAALSGTSMATPHISGAVALLRSLDAGLTVERLEELLISSAIPRTDSRYPNVPNNGYGHGLLDVFGAVSQLSTGSGTLQGRVMRPGDDLDEPIIQHDPVTVGFALTPITITAQVSDNVGVARVDLYARRAGDRFYTRIPMELASGDPTSGVWQGTIPELLVQMPAVEYYLEAMDGSGNTASSGSAGAPHRITVSLGVEPGYYQGFETNADGWVHGGQNDPWEWGVPTSGPGQAHSGEKVLATGLATNYPDEMNAFLMMPPIDLTGRPEGAVLQFDHWYHTETFYDFFTVYTAADDDEYWLPVAEFNGQSGGWKNVRIDLRAFGGQVAYVLFHAYSDYSVNYPGWYLDDVRVIGPDAVAPAAPSNLAAAPDSLGGIALSWTSPSDPDLDAIHVYRRSDEAGYDQVATLPGHATSYVDAAPPGGGPLHYVVTAVDLWGNESGHSNEATATPIPPDDLFFDNMESGPGAWTHGGRNDDWQHGIPTAGPAAYSGENVWATNLSGNYRSSAEAWLMTPAINLSGYTKASLSFQHWYETETNYDFATVQISTNGGSSWRDLARFSSSLPVGWEQVVLNLDAYVGQTIHLRFLLTTDISINRRGWYLDDVRVSAISLASNVSKPMAVALTKPKAERTGPSVSPAEALTAAPFTASRQIGVTGLTTQGAPGIMALPADATVTILETGRTVRTNPITGQYSLRHAAGTYTAVVESYGFYPVSRQVQINRDGVTTANFVLQPIPTGTVGGTVTDARTGEPVEGARVWLAEDARVAPVLTEADGSYSLTALEGSYTLHISRSGYYPFQATVAVPGGGALITDAELEPFVGVPGEIAYDDGTAENAWAYYSGGNGWAVRFSLPEGSSVVSVTGARLRFWDPSWPSPGGTDFLVAVYAADGPGGAPGTLLAGPVPGTARRDGNWTDVDLSHAGIMASGDFFIAYIQAGDYPNVPGLATDDNGPQHDRGWALVGGSWSPTAPDEGNRMIRALVETEVGSPTLHSPADETYTNHPAITVSGLAASGATVTVYRNGDAAGSATATEGQFQVEMTLHEGENVLTAVATANGGSTAPSAPVRVYLDTMAPTLAVASPSDGQRWNRGDLTVTGTVSDNMPGVQVTVNGTAARVGSDGAFSARILVEEGENQVTITARDRAGNETTELRTVHVQTTGPSITNLEPATDVVLEPGESVTIRFESESGLRAVYSLMLSGSSIRNLVGTPMTEVAPGVYEATYTPPSGTVFTDAQVVVQVEDAYGNQAQAVAPGKVSVTNNRRPEAVIVGPETVRTGKANRWRGNQSTDPDGRIVAHEWIMGDGARYITSGAQHAYTSPGVYTITLTVTDDKGATDTARLTVTVEP